MSMLDMETGRCSNASSDASNRHVCGDKLSELFAGDLREGAGSGRGGGNRLRIRGDGIRCCVYGSRGGAASVGKR